MEPHEKQKLQSLKQELVQLEQAVPVEAKKLTDLLKEQKRVVKETDAYKKKALEEIAAQQKLLDYDKKNLIEIRKKEEESMQAAHCKVQELTDTKKKLEKEIIHLNTSILNAQSESERVAIQLAEMQAKSENLVDIVAHYEEMKEKVAFIDEEHSKARNRMLELESVSAKKLADAKTELDRVKLETASAIMQRDKAESEMQQYQVQLHTKMSDYEIVRKRIESVWDKTFPELRLPLQ